MPQVRQLYENGRIDPLLYGEYDSLADMMFDYREQFQQFCAKQVSADRLKSWAMFEQEQPKAENRKDFEKMMKTMQREFAQKPEKKVKPGCNSPYPCGSGKKYKCCCMNKPKEEQLQIESEEEQQKRMAYRQWSSMTGNIRFTICARNGLVSWQTC